MRSQAEVDALTRWRKFRIVWAIVVTLTLAIMGGAQLPMPATFASTGAIAATILIVLVGLANAYTSRILCKQAYYVGRKDYEKLGFAVGGRVWQLMVEVSVFLLLYGTMVSAIQQVGEIWSYAIDPLFTDSAPSWITDGRVLMVFSVVLCLPFIFMNNLLILEQIGSFTTIVVAVSAIWLMVVAIQRGMPYLGVDGEFATVGFDSISNLANAVSTFGYCFYIQPIMMPMLAEMPKGKVGVGLLSTGTSITILGTAMLTYWICGFFGASLSGAAAIETGNFLQDDLGNATAQGILNMFNVVYLILSLPPFEFGTRHAVDSFIMSFFRKDTTNKLGKFLQTHFRLRQATLALLLYLSSLGLAVAFPNSSYKVIRITGAVGVGLVAYIIPVINHFCLYFGITKAQRAPREVIVREKLVRDSLQAAELLDVDLPATAAVTATMPDTFGPSSKDMENGGGPKDSATELANGVSEEDVIKVEQQVGKRRRSFVTTAKGRMTLRRRGKQTDVGDVGIPEEEELTKDLPEHSDDYIVGGATDYLYPTFKRNFGFVSFCLHIVLPLVVFLVGGFCSIWTLTHLDDV